MTTSASAEQSSEAAPPWSEEEESVLLRRLGTGPDGLTPAEAARRRDAKLVGLVPSSRHAAWRLALRQVDNPIVLLLIGATGVSMVLGDVVDGAIILVITAASIVFGFVQERGAVRVVEDLLATVRVRADVVRSGVAASVDLGDVVPGDIVRFRAGSVVPGDTRVLESEALLVDESALSGESFPVSKQPAGCMSGDSSTRANMAWCGTHVVSGTGSGVVVTVGAATEFGKVAERLAAEHVPTAFEVGLRRFGLLVMRAAGALVAVVLVVNVMLGRSVGESVLFSLALAVGLTPQLLPAIVTVTLSYAARQMAHRIDPQRAAAARQRFERLADAGFRVLGVASRDFAGAWPRPLSTTDEAGLEFRGFLCFADPVKPDARRAVAERAELGVGTKLVTGDNRHAAAHAARAVGISTSAILIGREVAGLDDEQLQVAAVSSDVLPRSIRCRRSGSSPRCDERADA